MAAEATQRQNLKKQAYDILKQKIITCQYKPGAMLNEAQIAAEHGFSRTPVREAISILEQEGFVSIVRNKGILVTDILLYDVQQIFQARIQVEPMIIRYYGQNMPEAEVRSWKEKFENPVEPDAQHPFRHFKLDTDMHYALVECSKNIYIINMMQKVYEKNMRIIVSSPQNREHSCEARLEHIAILDMLLQKDYDKAADMMREHIMHCRKAAIDSLYGMV